MTGMFNARDFGATGVVGSTERLELMSTGYKWIRYPAGTSAVIRHPVPGAPLDSVGIQRAVDAAHAAGGGTVLVPAGDYVVGPMRLCSHVELRLEPGARLWASPRLDDYAAQPNLLLADDAEGVALTGRGEIHGQSPQWLFPWLDEGPENWHSLKARRPGKMLLFRNCSHVAVENVRIFDSPCWTLVFERCRHVGVRGVFMKHVDLINADGIDLMDSEHVTIADCDLHVTDDGICLKNDANNPEASGVRNVTVTNCVIRTWCNGVKIGTESNGIFENITMSNIVVHNADDDLKGAEGGINIALCDGGVVRNVAFSNFVMRNVECPFYLVTTPRRLFQQAYREPRAGRMECVSISGVRADGIRTAAFVVGSPEAPIRDVALSGIHLRKTAEFRSEPFPQEVPECAQQYVTPFMFGSPEGGRRDCGDGLPAHGLYLRDVQGLRLRDFTIDCTASECRPCHARMRCRDIDLDEEKHASGKAQ